MIILAQHLIQSCLTQSPAQSFFTTERRRLETPLSVSVLLFAPIQFFFVFKNGLFNFPIISLILNLGLIQFRVLSFQSLLISPHSIGVVLQFPVPVILTNVCDAGVSPLQPPTQEDDQLTSTISNSISRLGKLSSLYIYIF